MLDREDDRYDHRPLGSLLQEIFRDSVSDIVFDDVEVERLHALGRIVGGLADEEAYFVEELL